MVYNKTYTGEKEVASKVLKYFVIEKNDSFGIGIDEIKGNNVISEYEYFTEDRQKAVDLVQKLERNSVTRIQFAEILDDYIA